MRACQGRSAYCVSASQSGLHVAHAGTWGAEADTRAAASVELEALFLFFSTSISMRVHLHHVANGERRNRSKSSNWRTHWPQPDTGWAKCARFPTRKSRPLCILQRQRDRKRHAGQRPGQQRRPEETREQRDNTGARSRSRLDWQSSGLTLDQAGVSRKPGQSSEKP